MTNPRYAQSSSYRSTAKGIWQFSFQTFKKVVSLLFSHLPHYSLLILLSSSPAIIIGSFTLNPYSQGQPALKMLSLLCGLISWAAITYSALEHLQGRSVSAVTSLMKGLQKVIPVAITYILFLFIVGIGLLFFLVPGLIFFSGLLLSVPIVVLEDLSPIAALQRSWNLSHGYKRAILNASILLFLLSLVFLIFISILLVAVTFAIAFSLSPLIAAIFSVILYVFALFGFQTSFPLASVVFYYQIRKEKEGIGLEELLKVFE